MFRAHDVAEVLINNHGNSPDRVVQEATPNAGKGKGKGKYHPRTDH